MSYNPNNPNGQATEANSAPVVIASNQSTLAVQDSTAESSLSTIATNTTPPTSGAGEYVRQDSTATIAKESGGNLASVATNTTGLNNTVGTAGSAIPSKGIVVQGSDGTDARAIKTDSSGNVGVNVQGTVPVSGTFWQTTQPVSLSSTTVTGTVAVTESGTWNVGSNAATGSAVPANAHYLGMNSSGNLAGLKDGTAYGDGDTTYLGVQTRLYNGSTYDRARGLNGVQHVNLSPQASGGWSPYLANAVTTTVTVSSAAGKFGGYNIINLNSAPAYLQCFDTTGAVTLGTTTPTFVIPLPANSTAANGVGANMEMSNGLALSNGLKVAATTTATGATTVSTGITGTLFYH